MLTVQARWQIAYKNVGYNGGDIFELDEGDYPEYKGDVKVLPLPEKDHVPAIEPVVKQVVKERNKQLKISKRRTK